MQIFEHFHFALKENSSGNTKRSKEKVKYIYIATTLPCDEIDSIVNQDMKHNFKILFYISKNPVRICSKCECKPDSSLPPSHNSVYL